MDVKVTDLRARLREVLMRVERGERIRISRRGRVVAVLASPEGPVADSSLADFVEAWRRKADLDPADTDPWADVRDLSEGPEPVRW